MIQNEDFAELMEFDVKVAILAACQNISAEMAFNCFKGLTNNYLNL